VRTCLAVLAFLAAEAAAADEPRLVVKPDAFPTLVNPNCSHCVDEARRRQGELRPDDRVLCWVRGYSDGGAVPYRFFLNPYRVISDSYGVFVHDPDAGFARGFAPSFQFRVHGWRNGVLVMKHADGTLYSCLTGLAFDGPKKGARLRPVPTLVSDWGPWLRDYPNAVAYHMYDKYRPIDLPSGANPHAAASRGPADPRLPADRVVLGVWDGRHARAYPLDFDARAVGLVREDWQGVERVILSQGETRTAAAYLPEAAPPRKYTAPRPDKNGESPEPKQDGERRRLTLSLADGPPGPAPFVDRETGSHWDVAGRAVQGELKGWTLTWLDGTQVKWFAWAAEYPATTVHGK
jgi:hypothetical protein